MSVPWFHVENLPHPDGVVSLNKQETRHALGPRRLGEGDEVVVFDGRGVWSSARIGGRDERGGLELVIGEHRTSKPESPSIDLAASLPKGDRLSTMLDMATQLGVSTFTPLKCEFSVVNLERKRQDPTERWARIMMEACKQSRRATVPTIGAESTLAAAIERATATGTMIMVGDAEGGSPRERLRGVDRVLVLIGPEGGFSPAEEAMLDEASAAGLLHRMAVGRGVLRVETAATAMLAAIRAGAID